ncbi:PREDICTED: homeobox-leucine zipper protein HOX3-like [Ipomoea nil]|uniref:homeobox-leucine zipper protein HOX3-like n=1 Tax=Ipomoea nil TaxID=35883 RepID=UPI0009015691|nr:PREDICTED: homeobox-leucine zipper protein HOX3-like [Ipomoea nil]
MADMPGSSTCLDLTISIPGSSSSSSGGECGMRDLDINQVPSGENIEGESMMMMIEEEDDQSSINGGVHPRKKLRLTKEQSLLLEESFRLNHTLNPKQKEVLAMQLRLKPRQVEVWFQNRRARSKLKQTEMECEYLKRWFGSLTEQNRRLQREVEELRAKKVGPPTVLSPHSRQPLPASTLTMCPRCERVSTNTTTTTTVRVVDKGGPTTQPTNLSAKTLQLLHPRHPSAAC